MQLFSPVAVEQSFTDVADLFDFFHSYAHRTASLAAEILICNCMILHRPAMSASCPDPSAHSLHIASSALQMLREQAMDPHSTLCRLRTT